MAREINKLTAREVAALAEPGMHADGAGLYLKIDQTLNKRWVLIFFVDKRRREMSIGPLAKVDLKTARLKAAEARALVTEGKNPIAERKREATSATTFGDVAKRAIANLEDGWRSKRTAAQWTSSLKTHAADIWRMPVADVSTKDVVAALSEIWQTIPETASRVRARIEHVLDVARVGDLRGDESVGANPARLQGHLKLLLGPQARTKGHHPAMRYEDIPAFIQRLQLRKANSARALEFTILGATRTTETRFGRWSEIEGDIWRLPGERLKSGREHIVTLTPRMLEILDEMKFQRGPGDYLFPGDQRIEPLSSMAMLLLLQRMGVETTVHGFRSTFRDWAGDCTEFPRDVAEMCLAHAVGDATELAYRRRTALAKRRLLMEAWAAHCTTPPSENVLQFKKA